VAVGVVGGATRSHPTAKAALKILQIKTAKELSEVIAAVGLAQNLAALRALADEGIQRGHMKLHARNIAVTACAGDDTADKVAEEMIKASVVRVDAAKEILGRLKGG
jgi:hydroxymethylglutaryl-CoA reductase